MAAFSSRRPGHTEESQSRSAVQILHRLGIYLHSYIPQLIAVFIFVLIGALTSAAGPYFIGRAIDAAIHKGDGTLLNIYSVLLVLTYLIGAAATRFQVSIMGIIGQRILAQLRADIFTTLQRLSLRYFDQHSTGDLMSRISNDTDVLNQLFGQGVIQVLGSLFGIVGIVVAMVALDWRLASVSFAAIPLMFLTTAFFSQLSRRAFLRTRESIGDVSAEIQEEIAGVRVAQAFNRTRVNRERFARRNAANRDANVGAVAITSALMPSLDILSTITTAAVAGYGGFLTYQHLVTIGTVVAFMTYVQQFFWPIQQLGNFYTTVQASFAAADRIFALIDTEPDLVDHPNAHEMPPIRGEVTFNSVSFSYGSRPSATLSHLNSESDLVLHAISLHAAPGEIIAIVGPTGAGKTTLVSLIGRLYDVTSGSVCIDGIDVRDVTRASLRRQMGVVLQDSFLFSGSIGDNIRYGRLDATNAEVEAAARAAHAHDFIQRLPQGYKSPVGERGNRLSQGQRQLIGIARAILANPRILILDEATSSVDTRTELLIQEALHTLLHGRTAFVIAHRLSTIREADQVLVLQGGRIVERGTHDFLLASGGLYADLYRHQFRDDPTSVPTEVA